MVSIINFLQRIKSIYKQVFSKNNFQNINIIFRNDFFRTSFLEHNLEHI